MIGCSNTEINSYFKILRKWLAAVTLKLKRSFQKVKQLISGSKLKLTRLFQNKYWPHDLYAWTWMCFWMLQLLSRRRHSLLYVMPSLPQTGMNVSAQTPWHWQLVPPVDGLTTHCAPNKQLLSLHGSAQKITIQTKLYYRREGKWWWV